MFRDFLILFIRNEIAILSQYIIAFLMFRVTGSVSSQLFNLHNFRSEQLW